MIIVNDVKFLNPYLDKKIDIKYSNALECYVEIDKKVYGYVVRDRKVIEMITQKQYDNAFEEAFDIQDVFNIEEFMDLEDGVKLTGGSSDHYKLPEDAKQLLDLIEHRNMNGNIKDIFKACYRLNQKDSTTDIYDVEKMAFYALRELGRMKGTKDYLGLAEGLIGDQSVKDVV